MRGPRPSCSSGPAATGPPTSTPGCPTTSPTGSAPTSTATHRPATSGSATSTSCRCRGAAVRRSARCWRTCPPPGCPARAAPPPPSRSRSTYETLRARSRRGRGRRVTSTGDRITAGEARRLACQAGIIPFVMGGKSVIHDQGRKKRLHDEPQRAAVASALPRMHRPSAARSPPPGARSPPHPVVRRGGKTNHRGRHPAVPLPSPPRPRPRLERELRPRRHDELHQADVSRPCAWHDRQPSAARADPTARVDAMGPSPPGGQAAPPTATSCETTASGSSSTRERLTYLPFLKMAHERATRKLNPQRIVPEDRGHRRRGWPRASTTPSSTQACGTGGFLLAAL